MNELDIQTAFVRWLGNSRGYTEHFSDPNGGAGALCDSVGTIEERPLLIEFKSTVDPALVAYSADRGSSIERKVCNTLKRLHEGSLLPNWSKDTLPLVWIIAEVIRTEAQAELHRMLLDRSQAWSFVYEFGTWAGDEYAPLEKGPPIQPDIAKMQEVVLPDLPWPGERRLPRRHPDELRAIADARGVAPLFDQFMKQAEQLGLRTKCNRDSLNLQAETPNTSSRLNVISVWPTDSGEGGLCVAADRERLARCFPGFETAAAAPCLQAPSRGYTGDRWYLRSDNEVATFWAWAAGQQP